MSNAMGRREFLAALAAAGVALAAGCRRTEGPGARLFVGFDRSRSVGPWLPAYVAAGCRLAVRMDPDRDHLALYRVERKTECFYDGPAVAGMERLQGIVLPELRDAPAADRTFPAKFVAEVARAAEDEGGPVLIGLFWDGGNDDGSAAGLKALRDAIRRLTGNPKVVGVGIFGVRRQNWPSVQRAFAPLGRRLEIHGPRDMGPDSLLEKRG